MVCLINCLTDWAIYRRHSQLRRSCCLSLSCDQFSHSCSAGGKIGLGAYSIFCLTRQNRHCLFHNQNLLFHNCNLCVIIFFAYVAWRKKFTVIPFSCSLSIAKISASVIGNEKHRYRPKKNLLGRALVRLTNTAPAFFLTEKLSSMSYVSKVTLFKVDLPCRKSACSCGSNGSTIGSTRA